MSGHDQKLPGEARRAVPPVLGVRFPDGDRDEQGRRGDPLGVSDLRAHDLRQLVLAGGAVAARPRRE